MNVQSNSQNELNKVLEKIQEIVEKSADGDYIYRGEPECYSKVSSSLYREYPHVKGEFFDVEGAQEVILEEAKTYTNKTDPIEILTELQHFGGKTNLIDFTEDYLIALFFACDGPHEKCGRVVLIRRESENYKIQKPSRMIPRVESQKSIFVQSPNGLVEPDVVITVSKDLKLPMLNYLRKYHRISVGFVYNDLHGFIRRSAYTEFLKGLTCQRHADDIQGLKEKREHCENAVKHYTEVIKQIPNFLVCYLKRGNAYCDIGEFDKTIQDYSKAIELNPEYVDAYSNRGNAYRDNGEFDKAIQDYNKAIELKPDHPFIYNNRGNVYRDAGEFDKSIQDYNMAIKLDPGLIDAYNGRGNVYLLKNELDCAIEEYNKAIELAPDDALPYNNRGNAYLRKGELAQAAQANHDPADFSNADFDRSIEDYSKAIELNPYYAKAYCNRGTVYREIGKFDQAIEDFNKAIELNSELAIAYLNRGQTWVNLHEWEKASADLNIAKNKRI